MAEEVEIAKANGHTTEAAALRDLIFTAGKPKVRAVEAWGTTVYIRELKADQVAAMQTRVSRDELRAMAIWLCASICDEHGNLVFTEADEQTVMGLGAGEVMRVGLECLKLNGQGQSAIETLLKNSEARTADSASA
jgi:hypothetical protein